MELATLAGVAPSTLEGWRKHGGGPDFVRLGKRILYPRGVVREFIAKNVRSGRTSLPKGVL